MPKNKEQLVLSKSESWKMFDEIAIRYDLLNDLLSFGMHKDWRKHLREFLPSKKSLTVLDLATGTADVLLTLVQETPDIEKGIGIDMSEKMLEIGRDKIAKKGLSSKLNLKTGDANHIPLSDASFDVTTMSFGIRNVVDPRIVIQEMYRVLKPDGRALILEFSMPKNPLIRLGNIIYLRNIVPLIGWIVSGHYRAYKYLNETIEQFPYGPQFCKMMTDAGFKNVKTNTLLFGVASIYQGDKICDETFKKA